MSNAPTPDELRHAADVVELWNSGRVDYDGDYRVLHLAVVLVVVVAACFGLGAGLS